ncbi:MAG: alpha/beta hydrolase, partial [Pseudonocardia sp.]|nr:alpha/beta hydrolase [Pseudonocardia sp.]
MRARYPHVEDVVVRDGVTIGYEVYEGPDPTILLPSSTPLAYGRQWKAQVPFLARHLRVITVDCRGNGRSDRPEGAEAYTIDQDVADLVAVLDATGTDRVIPVGWSGGGRRALALAAAHPDRVCGVVAIAPTVNIEAPDFEEVRAIHDGPEKINRHYIAEDFEGFLEFLLGAANTDPHSTKPFEDCIGWARETTAEVWLDYVDGYGWPTRDHARDLCAAVRCPVLVVQGSEDVLVPHAVGAAVAEWTGGTLVTLPGGGHNPAGRDPVRVNLLIRDFVDGLAGRSRPPR